MLEFFNTTAGAASILGLIFSLVYAVNERAQRRYAREAQDRLERNIEEGRRRQEEAQRRHEEAQRQFEISMNQGNERLQTSIVEGNKRTEDGQKRLERAEEMTRQMMAHMDDTTKEILREIARRVA